MGEWRQVPGFPGYSVNSEGIVRNDRRDSFLASAVNQQGIAYVSLVRDGVQHKRGLGLIVADVFLDPPPNRFFNTPIYLDGDKTNVVPSNLMWRPKWFAMKYHRQFGPKTPRALGTRPYVPIEELETREQFEDVWVAVMTFGLIWIEVYTVAWNHTHHEDSWSQVWPTGQQFRLL